MRDGVKEGVGVAAGARTILVLVPEVILQAVVRTRGFHELSDTVLARVLRSDRLAVDELDLVQAVREWAHVSSVSAAQRGRGGSQNTPPVPDAQLGVLQAVLGRPVPEVAALPVQELRLPLLAPSELATLESHNQRDLLIPVSCLDFGGAGFGIWGEVGATLMSPSQVESIAAAWRSHALRRSSGVPPQLCRPRRGTRPRDHHRHLDPHAK